MIGLVFGGRSRRLPNAPFPVYDGMLAALIDGIHRGIKLRPPAGKQGGSIDRGCWRKGTA